MRRIVVGHRCSSCEKVCVMKTGERRPTRDRFLRVEKGPVKYQRSLTVNVGCLVYIDLYKWIYTREDLHEAVQSAL